ncbi:MAG: helix-turn-helix domain-containing protein, partial [Clostridia bacterium]|nr:helix-turn-helix domain-containing protein [Clostridia bacterium]
VSAWENGVSQPNLETIAKLCDIFDETADALLFD